MNTGKECHEIPGCPGLYVDAFRGAYLKKTADSMNTFILTHYHGDHYGNMPRDGRYQGKAQIHCTPVTAALLREVHNVPERFLVEHPYGQTFVCPTTEHSKGQERTKVTFYDANHCPGAAILFIESTDGKCHLHTGDFRFHPKMKSFPLIKHAAINRKLELLFLDTTYGNPKHDFVPQEVAVDSIASQVEELLGSERSLEAKKTLVLLSCYSIGKEKVLWESSNRCNQRIYVTEKKLKMLHCIQGHCEDISSQIITRCTRDPTLSDIHVVPMGLAGDIWPFFRPNPGACVGYAQSIPSSAYNKVVAFLPTGWADASNWNKKNSVSRFSCKGLDVEVRLISYSEHSSFSELKACVAFLNPRKVIPTVYKDAKDARKIEALFPVDEARAKKHFLSSMFGAQHENESTLPPVIDLTIVSSEKPSGDRKRKKLPDVDEDSQQDDISTLQAMGFSESDAASALQSSNGNVVRAVEALVNDSSKRNPTASPLPIKKPKEKNKTSPTHATVSQAITNFFPPKQSR